MKLNLGAHGNRRDRPWIGLDLDEYNDIDLRADCRRLPFPPHSFDQVYAGHLLEHLPPFDLEGAVNHWIDMLVEGGRLGIVVPDVFAMQAWVNAGRMDGRLLAASLDHDGGAYHQTAWSSEQLRWFLSRWNLKEFGPVSKLPSNADWPMADPVPDWQIGAVIAA